eukprot:SAG31_NODE_3497_length_4195_cov_5.065430_8_plen_39_part_00
MLQAAYVSLDGDIGACATFLVRLPLSLSFIVFYYDLKS